MSESTPFGLFIDLINFDKDIHVRELEIQKQKQAIVLQEEKKKQSADDLAQTRGALHDITKLVDEKELEMKSLEAQEAEKKKRMDHVTNQKEYKSMRHEIELIAAQQLAIENILLAAWNQFEHVKKEYEKKETAYHQIITDIDVQIHKHMQDIAILEQEVTDRQKVRAQKATHVPQEWYDKYMMMRARTADPVVPVLDGSCSACFHYLTEQDLLLIKKNKLMQCKGCYRFLYNEALAK